MSAASSINGSAEARPTGLVEQHEDSDPKRSQQRSTAPSLRAPRSGYESNTKNHIKQAGNTRLIIMRIRF